MIAIGRHRIDIVAVSGLIILGIFGSAPPAVIFSGYGHPALATIIAVFFVSEGIVKSGAMHGLGQALAKRARSLRAQILGVSVTGAFLSAFMNNVGATGLMLPTAVRMAARADRCPGTFGLPLAMAAILGGTATLIGSAPNIIVASYMFSATGKSFKMFDYAPHGLAMLAAFSLAWILCRSCGIELGSMNQASAPGSAGDQAACSVETFAPDEEEAVSFAPLANTERIITLGAIAAAVIAVSLGLLHPAYGFGAAALIMFLGGVLKLPEAFRSIDLKIVFFLGAMLGIGAALEYGGALELLGEALLLPAAGIDPFWMIALLVFATSALSNAINNAAAAVFAAPLAIGLASGSALETAAALMATAAGANLTLLLPTHQAALLVMSRAPFAVHAFIRFGLVLTILCGFAAAGAIYFVWQ